MSNTLRLTTAAALVLAVSLAGSAFAWGDDHRGYSKPKKDPHHGTCVVGNKANGGSIGVLTCQGDFCYITCSGVTAYGVPAPKVKFRNPPDESPRRRVPNDPNPKRPDPEKPDPKKPDPKKPDPKKPDPKNPDPKKSDPGKKKKWLKP